MAIFGIDIDNDEKVQAFMEATQKRFSEPGLARNPFSAKLKRVEAGVFRDFYIISIEPLYPPYYIYGVPTLLAPIIFIRELWSWAYIPGLVILSAGFFWTSYFYYLMLKLGLRKAGFKGKVKLVRNGNLLGRLVEKVL